MPESILNALIEIPTCTLDALEPVERLTFVIDQTAEPYALASLYQLGEPFEPSVLLKDTEFDALARKGPFSFSAEPGSVLAEQAAAICLNKRCGMAVAAATPEQAMAHLRTVLKVNDGSGGQSVLSLGNPHLWAALSLTAGASAPRLFGPMTQVLTPVPTNLGVADQPWYRWVSPTRNPVAGPPSLYTLPEGFGGAARVLRLLYWLDEQHEVFGSPKADQVPAALANLLTLIEHDIDEGRYLAQLSRQVNGPLLIHDVQAMGILRSDQKPFSKARQLACLAGQPGQ